MKTNWTACKRIFDIFLGHFTNFSNAVGYRLDFSTEPWKNSPFAKLWLEANQRILANIVIAESVEKSSKSWNNCTRENPRNSRTEWKIVEVLPSDSTWCTLWEYNIERNRNEKAVRTKCTLGIKRKVSMRVRGDYRFIKRSRKYIRTETGEFRSILFYSLANPHSLVLYFIFNLRRAAFYSQLQIFRQNETLTRHVLYFFESQDF